MDRPPLPRNRAILLLGPTGSGKTPLGDFLQKSGLAGRRCLHFDFGGELRAAAADPAGYGLNEKQSRTVRRVLETRSLLEDTEFPIAKRAFERFLRRHDIRPEDLVVLNGLPRHVGQARDMDDRVDVLAVVILRAGPGPIRARIRENAGGDRAGRTDDAPADVEGKLRTFEERTRPLAGYYSGHGVPLIVIPVEADTTAEEMARLLAREVRL